MFRDEDVRTACFLSLDVLCAQFGDEIPYRGGLERGFAFRGARVPFLNYQKGIYRAAAQRGPAALSLHTSYSSPYDDAAVDDGFRYAYRAGAIDQSDNRALRAVAELRVPIVYFVGTRPGCYRAEYPWYVSQDEPKGRFVLVTPGRMTGPADEREAVSLEDPVERRYAVREVRVRLHQARFRGAVLPAYRERCTICSLRELRLLDAAHIVADFDVSGIAAVSNGLSLCSIHHRAFDHDLLGISPDCRVHLSRRLLDDEDGPMLDLLKACHGSTIEVPSRQAWRPDPERLAVRFERFQTA